MFQRVLLLLSITKHWFRSWFGTEQVPGHSLNQRCCNLLTHINVTRPQRRHTMSWILVNIGSGNGLLPGDTKARPECRLYCELNPLKHTSMIFDQRLSLKIIWKCGVQNDAFLFKCQYVVTLRSKQNGWHCAHDILNALPSIKDVFCILIPFPRKFVSKEPGHGCWELVRVMAWHRTGDNAFITWSNDDTVHRIITQGWFWFCDQPMRDVVTK